MTLDGFVTFLSLIVAAYALVPSATRLRVTLHGGLIVAVSVLFLAAALYFEFFGALSLPCPKALGRGCQTLTLNGTHFSPKEYAFFAVFAWLVIIFAIVQCVPPSARSLPALSKLAAELAHEKRYSALVKALTPNMGLIASALLPSKPAQLRTQDAAREMVRLVTSDTEIIRYIADQRPSFGIALLHALGPPAGDFAVGYLNALLNNTGSELYREVKAGPCEPGPAGYSFTASEKILKYLFADSRAAYELEIYGPLGDRVVEHIDSDLSYRSYLNGSGEHINREKWSDMTYIALRCFDYMVSNAAHSGIKWHMWLYYLPRIVEGLVRLHQPDDCEINPYDEWPTRGHYLIYWVLVTLCGWVLLVRALPGDSPHLSIQRETSAHENGNIPKSAALALGLCVRIVIMSEKISDRFKLYIVGIAVRLICDIRPDGIEGRFRRTLVNALVKGGPGEFSSIQYTETLKEYTSRYERDRGLPSRALDLAAALEVATTVRG